MTPSATGGTSDGQVGTPLEGHRATALRPRRLVERDAEIAEVIERLALTPLTTVTGPGGVGKTSLALTVAAAAAPQFSDGVFVIWPPHTCLNGEFGAPWPYDPAVTAAGCRRWEIRAASLGER